MGGPDVGRAWKEADELYFTANKLATSFAGLASKEGVTYGQDAMRAMEGAMQGCAQDFLTLDPQKIIDEWDRMQKVAKDVGVDISEEVTVELGATKDHLQGWYGAGADAFRRQVDLMRAFAGKQFDYTTTTIQALASMLRVAVQSRDDFVVLAEATMKTVDKAFNEKKDTTTDFMLKVGNGVVKAVLGVIEDPKKAIFAIAENVLDIAVEGATSSVSGGKLNDVVGSFVDQRDRLLHGYEQELAQVADLLKRRQEEVLSTRIELFEPFPLNLNVNSPDFRYDNFMSKDMDPGQFGPRVDVERQKYVEERQNRLVSSDSAIQRRLAGE
jgi:hypothetical protein